SKLSQGDRLLVIKPDGTFLVHQKSKMNAINYQGPGASVVSECTPEGLRVKAERQKPMHEVIDVIFRSLQAVHTFAMEDDSNLKLFGSERELSGLLMEDLSVLEKGLKPIQIESHVRTGFADIVARDVQGRLVIVEVKRADAGLDAVTQLARYVKELSSRKNEIVRGILAAPHITGNALTMLHKGGLEFVRFDYEVPTNSTAKIKGLEKKQKGLMEFEPSIDKKP
ncbi:MAG TPA: endonuclease NucS domain-containing protein, partial [Candidatus Norongarragalinales archaeon]|nr:endonuclease NucS domain-containing protein [Candidatus Norongarragalinales archaeon]